MNKLIVVSIIIIIQLLYQRYSDTLCCTEVVTGQKTDREQMSASEHGLKYDIGIS